MVWVVACCSCAEGLFGALQWLKTKFVFIESMDGINEDTLNVKTTFSCNLSNVDSVAQLL
jgi:hypothetical protein